MATWQIFKDILPKIWWEKQKEISGKTVKKILLIDLCSSTGWFVWDLIEIEIRFGLEILFNKRMVKGNV
jgi:hypothetical protein